MPYEKRRAYWARYSRKKTSTDKGDGDDAIAFIPRNELNVREVFAQRASRLGYQILESRIPFPDYILGAGSRRLLAEAEFRTSDFLRHRHDLARCDLIIVWTHDLNYIPVPVLELSTEQIHRPRRGRRPLEIGPGSPSETP